MSLKRRLPKKSSAQNFCSGCPLACALDLIDDHWTLLIIRDMMFLDRHEYKDMLASPEKISSNILSDRLKKLETAELIASLVHPQNKKRKLYYLSEKGKDLIYIMVAIATWSAKHQGGMVDIPPERKIMLLNNPKQMIQLTLAHLETWEIQHKII